MDWTSEKYPWLSLLLGLGLVFVWGVISLAHAYDRSLGRMKDSYAQGFMLVERLGGVLDTLARLGIDQQAFLSTGDERFQDGVVESAETLSVDVAVLDSMAARTKSERPLLNGLSQSIRQVLASVADSDDIRERRGKDEALAFFDSREDSIEAAKWRAEQLRIKIAGRISDRIGSARGVHGWFQDLLFDAPREATFAGGAALGGTPASKRLNLAALR
jgi:hypothetical protein